MSTKARLLRLWRRKVGDRPVLIVFEQPDGVLRVGDEAMTEEQFAARYDPARCVVIRYAVPQENAKDEAQG